MLVLFNSSHSWKCDKAILVIPKYLTESTLVNSSLVMIEDSAGSADHEEANENSAHFDYLRVKPEIRGSSEM